MGSMLKTEGSRAEGGALVLFCERVILNRFHSDYQQISHFHRPPPITLPQPPPLPTECFLPACTVKQQNLLSLSSLPPGLHHLRLHFLLCLLFLSYNILFVHYLLYYYYTTTVIIIDIGDWTWGLTDIGQMLYRRPMSPAFLRRGSHSFVLDVLEPVVILLSQPLK